MCSKEKKQDTKIFILCNIEPNSVNSVGKLKDIIKFQLSDETVCKFDVGYLQGSNAVLFRSKEDITDIWSKIRKGENVTLWCNGLKQPRSKRQTSTADSEDEEIEETLHVKKRSKTNDKEEKVESVIKDLRGKHSSSYTPMQYRIWVEMMIGGLHSSSDDPPTTSMFGRAGGMKKAVAVSNTSHANNSPLKNTDSRTKCYKQLSDLKSLLENGILSSDEYQAEKDIIISMLKKLV